MSKRALISGGGIAGLALSFWLERIGIETVVIDRVPRFEPLGHYIALKGNGVEVIRQMGLESACRAREVRSGRDWMRPGAPKKSFGRSQFRQSKLGTMEDTNVTNVTNGTNESE